VVVELAKREDVIVKELVVADSSVVELGGCGFEEAAGGGEELLNRKDSEFSDDVARVDSEEDFTAEELILVGDVLVNGPRDDKVDDCELTASEVSDDIRLDVPKLVTLTGVGLAEVGKVGAVEVPDVDATELIELDELFRTVDAEMTLEEALRGVMAVVATLLEAEVPGLELEPELLEAGRVLNNRVLPTLLEVEKLLREVKVLEIDDETELGVVDGMEVDIERLIEPLEVAEELERLVGTFAGALEESLKMMLEEVILESNAVLAEVLTDDETLVMPMLKEPLGLDEEIELGVSADEGTSELLGDGEALDVAPKVDDELDAVLEGISDMDDDAVVGRLVGEVTLRTTELADGVLSTLLVRRLVVKTEPLVPNLEEEMLALDESTMSGLDGLVTLAELLDKDIELREILIVVGGRLVVDDFTTEKLGVSEDVEPGMLVAEGMDGVVEFMTTDDTITCSLAGVVVDLGEGTFVELADEALGLLVDGEPGRLVAGKVL
jgi:hypothetical protein